MLENLANETPVSRLRTMVPGGTGRMMSFPDLPVLLLPSPWLPRSAAHASR